jgi:hypothetical protein
VTIHEVILNLWPFWLCGMVVLLAIFFSEQKSLLRVEWNRVLPFASFMVRITAFRYLLYRFLLPWSGLADPLLTKMRAVSHLLPWQTTFGVFWEEAIYTIPLVLFYRLHKEKRWFWDVYPLTFAMFMASFAVGHLYQGVIPAIIICFYIPFSVKMGQKYGFGSMILAHIAYDLITLLSMPYLAGG